MAFLDGNRMTLITSESILEIATALIFKSETRNQGITNLQEKKETVEGSDSGRLYLHLLWS